MSNVKSITRNVIVASILGKKFPVEIFVTHKQTIVAENALRATRLLETTLAQDNVSVKQIVSMIGAKHTAALAFEREFNFSWPL